MITSKEFEERKQRQVRSLVDKHIKAVETIEKHTVFDCEVSGRHILDGFATGASDGHYIVKCLLCDYREEGWD